VANLLLAILLYSAVNWMGVEEPKPILASPVVGSVAERAGLQGGETVLRAARDGAPLQPVESFDDLRWLLTQGALDAENVRVEVQRPDGRGTSEVLLALSTIGSKDADAQLFRKIGILGPWTQPVIGQVIEDSAASKSGLREGDVVQSVGSVRIIDGQQLREVIRMSVNGRQPLTQTWRIERNGAAMELAVTPEAKLDGGQTVGRIGAFVGAPPEFVTIRYGLFDGLWNGAARTWEVSLLTLRMMGRMVIGEASLKNLSGPLTIADYAGKSASLGLTQYLVFLALISVSLGVLNLLPLPVLDGGHLMYYLWEGVTGKSVSDAWMDRLQRGGVAVLLVMMCIALFNDVTRLFG
jgi:regulator of sigma E protease